MTNIERIHNAETQVEQLQGALDLVHTGLERAEQVAEAAAGARRRSGRLLVLLLIVSGLVAVAVIVRRRRDTETEADEPGPASVS